MNLNEYAKRRGVSNTAIAKAIKKGRLSSRAAKKIGDRWEIDPEVADREWSRSTHPNRGGSRGGGRPMLGRQTSLFTDAPFDDAPIENSSNGSDATEENAGGTSHRLLTAQAMQKTFQALKARLEYEQLARKLVLKSDVERTAFEVARVTRDRMLQIPARIADEIAAMSDRHDVETLLYKELEDALTTLADELKSNDD